MNEQEWLKCTDPEPMLEFLWGKVSARKLRLLACACCRRIWPLLRDRRCQRAVEIAEKYADGRVTLAEISAARDAAVRACMDAETRFNGEQAMSPAYSKPAYNAADDAADTNTTAHTAAYFAATHAAEAVANSGHEASEYLCYPAYAAAVRPVDASSQDESQAAANTASVAAMRKELAEQARLLHDIFGNPFRKRVIDRSWLTPTVMALARAIYEEGSFTDLPVLADALEEAGCNNDGIVNHLRSPGPHVLGCWAVDLLQGKS